MVDLYKDRISILCSNGEYESLLAWQRRYGLPEGSAQIGKYFSYNEAKFRENIQDYGSLLIAEPLMRIMDECRKMTNVPFRVSGFNRSKEKQKSLHAQGFKAAKNSPHVVKLAVDWDTFSEQEVNNNVAVARIASQRIGIAIRIGHKQYLNIGQTFVHIDVTPMYYGEGMPWSSEECPDQWRVAGLEW